MRVLILDNYDSFTYNLVQIIRDLPGLVPVVKRNRAITVEEASTFDAIVLSPGPGLPEEAGIMPELITRLAPKLPILGVCLGHQAIAQSFGAKLQNMNRPHHGVATRMTIQLPSSVLFQDLPEQIEVGRYHSWVVDPATVPDCLRVTALDDQGEIMALEHKYYPVYGLQFHPESILTPDGETMVHTFFNRITAPEFTVHQTTDHASTTG